MLSSPFESKSPEDNLKNKIKNSDIIFVGDLFADQYAGGAELTQII